MKKVYLHIIWALLLVFSFSSVAQVQKKSSVLNSETPKPNIIFILTDDLGYGDIGVFFQQERQKSGKAFELTPQLDKMAQEGARFTDQYCNAPVCAPSRASFLTGLNQGNASVRNNQFDKMLEDNHTVANLLKRAGYNTALIGKWGLQGATNEKPNWPAHPLKRGFDYFYGYMRHADGHEHYPKEGLYRGKKEVWENYTNVADDLDKCYTTDLWTARAKQWIIEQQATKPQQPFFMFLAYDAPHAVLELPTQAYPKGGGLNGGLQWLGKKGNMINTASGLVDSYRYPEYEHASFDHDNNPQTPELDWPDTYKRYASSTKRIDDGVGDLLQLLKDLKIDEHTLVVFTSDNGISNESYLPAGHPPFKPTFFGSNAFFDGIKRDVWEGGIRVPTLARWPNKIAANTLIKSPSMLSDWLATFAEIAQTEAPARTDGVSLVPTLLQQPNSPKSSIYVEYFQEGKTPNYPEFEVDRRGRKRGEMQMLRLGDYVGVRYDIQSADDDFEIYNVVTDPKQTRNLARELQYKALQREFKARALQAHRSDTEAKRPYDSALIPSTKLQGPWAKGWIWKNFASKVPYVASSLSKTAKRTESILRYTASKAALTKGLNQLEGYFYVEKAGAYDFSFQSKQKAIVRLHQALLFDADYGYNTQKIQSGPVYLDVGYHPITVSLLQTPTVSGRLSIQWKSTNDSTWENIENKIYHTNKN